MVIKITVKGKKKERKTTQETINEDIKKDLKKRELRQEPAKKGKNGEVGGCKLPLPGGKHVVFLTSGQNGS